MMKIFNTNHDLLESSKIDLNKGYLRKSYQIKEDASPIDNVSKFAWDDKDYEEIEIYVDYDHQR